MYKISNFSFIRHSLNKLSLDVRLIRNLCCYSYTKWLFLCSKIAKTSMLGIESDLASRLTQSNNSAIKSILNAFFYTFQDVNHSFVIHGWFSSFNGHQAPGFIGIRVNEHNEWVQ